MIDVFKIIIRRIATQDIKQLLKENKCGFDNVFQKMNIIEASDGKCVAEMTVEEEHTNIKKTLHGGLISSLIDAATTYALFTHKDCESVPSVSVDLHVTFIKGAKIGEQIVIDACTLKAGGSIAFTKCVVKNKENCDILAIGNHTKFLLRPNKK